MSDAVPKTTAETDIVIDIRGDVSGMGAVGENIYAHALLPLPATSICVFSCDGIVSLHQHRERAGT
jgi:hypothetical protein